MKKLLLVEDDQSLGATLQERLIKESYEVYWAQTLKQAESFFGEKNTDLIILDVGLPDGTGFNFADWVRVRSGVPFIFVTAQTTAEDRLRGYELGAEEYIPKPFHLKELLLRVKHVMDNHSFKMEKKLFDIIIDFTRRQIINNKGLKQDLPDKDFQVLKMLIDVSPRPLSREEILNRIWGEGQYPTNRTIDNIILRLRQQLGPQVGLFIRSVRGVGYAWEEAENV